MRKLRPSPSDSRDSFPREFKEACESLGLELDKFPEGGDEVFFSFVKSYVISLEYMYREKGGERQFIRLGMRL